MGNFWGRKLSRISSFCGYSRKFSLWHLGAWHLLAVPASNPQKFSLQKSYFLPICKSFPLYSIEMVVTYMSHVKALATKIKIESSDQRPFWEQIKVTSILWKARGQECVGIWPLNNCKSSDRKLQKEPISDEHQSFDLGHKHFNRQHISDSTLIQNRGGFSEMKVRCNNLRPWLTF